MKDQTTDTRRDTKIPKALRNARLSKDGKWRVFPKVPNLLQYVSTGTYFARVKVAGKIIRQSLLFPGETEISFTTAKLRVPDFIKKQLSQKRIAGGPITFAHAQKLYEQDLEVDHSISENSKRYRRYCVQKLNQSWATLATMKLARITATDCKVWAGKLAKEIDDQYFNNVLGTFRAILKRGGISADDDPTADLKRLSVEVPVVVLPTIEQFGKILTEMQNSGAGKQQACADFARGLAFSGCRLSEARQILRNDVSLEHNTVTVRSAKVRRSGAVAESTRTIPMIPPMRELVERLLKEPGNAEDRLFGVGECEKSLVRACKNVGIAKLTHHKLRDLFATIAIESGVPIPTVADWLGHKDGGALLLRRYRKHRDEHSRQMAAKVTFGQTAVAA
jgi:integrase